MNDKFRLTNEKMIYNGHTLYRIQAMKDITLERTVGAMPKVIKAGTLGGWVENESNLCTLDSSWIADEAKVYGDAGVIDGALIAGNAEVYGWAEIDRACVSGNAKVYGNAVVCGRADINGNAQIFDDAAIVGSCRIDSGAMIHEKAVIINSNVTEYADIYGRARVVDYINVCGRVVACGTATLNYSIMHDDTITGSGVYTV